jgi:small subunit ribosomal protein S5
LRGRGRGNYNNQERRREFDVAAWEPVTALGKMVKAGSITSLEQIFGMGKSIEENGIVDALLPNINSEVVEIRSVQRMTSNNRKQKFRVTAIVGDGNGHVGVGAAKDVEVKAAIDSAINAAKRNIIPVTMGCGSWQCTCGQHHSLPFVVKGKCGSVEVLLKPAPKGLGIVASKHVKRMLELAGVKDIWSFSKGRTRTTYNVLMAVMAAFEHTINMKNLENFNRSK